MPKTRNGRRHIRLKVIPEPDEGTRSVFITDSTEREFVFIRGVGEGKTANLSLDCGKCGKPLIQDLKRDQIRWIVLRCPRCGTYNDTE